MKERQQFYKTSFVLFLKKNVKKLKLKYYFIKQV